MDPGSHPIADALNTKPKFLASITITDPQWADTTVLSGDLVEAIAELKAKPGGRAAGARQRCLIRWLLDQDLVDEMNLLIVPVVLGQARAYSPPTAATSRSTWSSHGPTRKA